MFSERASTRPDHRANHRAGDLADPSADHHAGQGAVAVSTQVSTSVSTARQRKLHVGHFAFMRAVVQGLDPRGSWVRFLRVEGELTDQRTVRATIA